MSHKRVPLTSPVPQSPPNIVRPSEMTRTALRAAWTREGALVRGLRERHLIDHERAVVADVLELVATVAAHAPIGTQEDARKLLLGLAYAVREGKEPWGH